MAYASNVLFVVRALPKTTKWVKDTVESLKRLGDTIVLEFPTLDDYYNYDLINKCIPRDIFDKYICIIDSGMILTPNSTSARLNNLSNVYCVELRRNLFISRILIYKHSTHYDYYGKFKLKVLPAKAMISYTSDIVFTWIPLALDALEKLDLPFFEAHCFPQVLSADSPSFDPNNLHSVKKIKTPKTVLTSDIFYYYYISKDKRAFSRLSFNGINANKLKVLQSINGGNSNTILFNKYNYVRVEYALNVYKPSNAILKQSAINTALLCYIENSKLNDKKEICRITEGTSIVRTFQMAKDLIILVRNGRIIKIYRGLTFTSIGDILDYQMTVNPNSVFVNKSRGMIRYVDNCNLVNLSSNGTKHSTKILKLENIVGSTRKYIYCREYLYNICTNCICSYEDSQEYKYIVRNNYKIAYVCGIKGSDCYIVLKIDKTLYKIAYCVRNSIMRIYENELRIPNGLKLTGITIKDDTFLVSTSDKIFTFIPK